MENSQQSQHKPIELVNECPAESLASMIGLESLPWPKCTPGRFERFAFRARCHTTRSDLTHAELDPIVCGNDHCRRRPDRGGEGKTIWRSLEQARNLPKRDRLN